MRKRAAYPVRRRTHFVREEPKNRSCRGSKEVEVPRKKLGGRERHWKSKKVVAGKLWIASPFGQGVQGACHRNQLQGGQK